MKSIAVIGAGQMGAGIAQVAATQGRQVIVVDIKDEFLDRGKAMIQKSLAKFVSKGKMTAEQEQDALQGLMFTTDMSEVADSGFVIEAVPEIIDLKKETFSKLDDFCGPETILASNTSSISITEIASVTERPDRVIGMHFMNPVPLMKLVEVIKGQLTSQATEQTTLELTRALGKEPWAAEDYPGFVSNRLLCPMINEAVICLHEGVAGAEAIDNIMKLGMNHPMGPLALADLIGLDTVLHIMDVLYDGFQDSKYRASPLLRRMVAAGLLGRKTGRGFYEY